MRINDRAIILPIYLVITMAESAESNRHLLMSYTTTPAHLINGEIKVITLRRSYDVLHGDHTVDLPVDLKQRVHERDHVDRDQEPRATTSLVRSRSNGGGLKKKSEKKTTRLKPRERG